jgi:hypothetical protein
MDIQIIAFVALGIALAFLSKILFQKKNLLKIVAVETVAVTKLFNIPSLYGTLSGQ